MRRRTSLVSPLAIADCVRYVTVSVCSLSELGETSCIRCVTCPFAHCLSTGKSSCVRCVTVSDRRGTGKQAVRCINVSDRRDKGKQAVPMCDRVSLLTVRSRKNKPCPIRDVSDWRGRVKQAQCVRYVTVSDWQGTGKQAVSDT